MKALPINKSILIICGCFYLDLRAINAANDIRETGNGMGFLSVCILSVNAWHTDVVFHMATQGK